MSDLLSAASLFLAALGFVYNSWYDEMRSARDTVLPQKHANRVKERALLGTILRSRAIPLSVASVVLALILLPDLVRVSGATLSIVLNHETKTRFKYDAVATLYCAVSFFAICFAWHSSEMALNLRAHRAKADQAADIS